MRAQLFETLEKTGGLKIPIYPVRGGQWNRRNPDGSKAQPFPDALISPRKTP
jgi:hypothetical protein